MLELVILLGDLFNGSPGSKLFLMFQSSLPVRPATKAEQMRECLRSLKQNNKVIFASYVRVFLLASLKLSYYHYSFLQLLKFLVLYFLSTCYQDDDAKVKTAFNTLLTYAKNVATNPNEEKFRKIRLSNAAFQVRIFMIRKCILHLF